MKMAVGVPPNRRGGPVWPPELPTQGPPSAATKGPTAKAQDVRKNRNAGVSPAWRLDNSFCVNGTFAGWKPALHFLLRTADENRSEREGTTSVVPRERRTSRGFSL